MPAAGTLASLSAAEIDGIASLWKRGHRELVTSFNGTSMLPAISPGQQVTVTCGVEPVVGDVAVFRYNDQVGVHRVIARSATWLLTWGDANPLPDEPVLPSRIIGVIRDVPAAPRSLRRKVLGLVLGSPRQPVELLTRRIQVIYRLRTLWKNGPRVFAGALLRAFLRRVLPN